MNSKRINDIVGKFKTQKVLVFGDLMLDHYVKGKVERLNPEAPVPILHTHEEWFATGGAGNTAKNLASLGAKTCLIGIVGNDQYAEVLKMKSTEEGYETKLIVDESRPTTRKVRFLVNNQQLLRVDYETKENVSPNIEDEVIAEIKKKIKEHDGIIISDYAKGGITERIAKTIINEAKKNKKPILVDVKASRSSFVIGASLVSPNRKESYEFLGLNILDRQISEAEVARRLKKKMKADIIIRLGGDGMYVCASDGTDKFVKQKNKVEVYDESGAGDTSVSVMLLAKLCGAKNEEMAELGNAGGATVVQKIGSVAITVVELEKMALQNHN